jgi:hypothetical protein
VPGSSPVTDSTREATVEFFTVEGYKRFRKENEIKARLAGPIKEILAFELASGNQITLASDDWPTQNANIWLKNRFAKDYRAQYPTLKYTFVCDAHYWLDEYHDEENQEFIGVEYSLSNVPDSPQT